jgi:hypothetical protein
MGRRAAIASGYLERFFWLRQTLEPLHFNLQFPYCAGSSFKQRFWHAMHGLSAALAVRATMPLTPTKVRRKIVVTIMFRI